MRVRVTYNIEGGVQENQPPIITDIPAQTNNEEDVISLQVNATDPDGNNISYSATGLPAGLSINPSTGLISGTITIGAETSSPYTVTVTVQDDGSPVKSTDKIFSWAISAVAVNQPPVITPISNQSNTEEDLVSLQVNATDPENGVLTYSASSLPTGLSINSSTGLISGTISVGAETSSPYITTITVTDDGSPAESSDEVFTWNVSAINQSPILSPIGNQTNVESDVVSLQVNATDPDLNTLTYSATGLPTGLTINSSTGLISGTIDASANTGSPYTTTVTVADDGVPSESDSEVLTWTVNEVIAVVANNKYYGAGNALINTFSGDVPAFNSGDPNVIQGSASLTRIELGTSCSSIGLYAFGSCTNLNGPIIIGDGVVNSITTINSAAFYGCSSLIGPVVIGNSVTNIGAQSFGGYTASHPIEELYVDIPSNIWGSATFSAVNNTQGSSPNLIIYVSPTYFGIGVNYDNSWRNSNFVNGGAQIVNWDNYPNPIPNNPIDTILYDAGDNPITASIINGDIPNDYYSFGSNGASSAVRAEFGTSCTSIGNYAFGGGNFTLDGPLIIGDGVANSITNIGSAAFYYCANLNGPIVIGSTVTSIGSYAFAYNVPITELYVDTPSSSWTGTTALGNGTGGSMIIHVSPTYFGIGSNYDAAWRTAQGVAGGATIVNWDNYPNPIPN